ncbi:MAG: SUMF1/EgtB/PvdO family nonheme iron enzyme [Thiomargarita sp.]|nr:SUMF1/EgtB/PvdO family nonheme iron enzyme [Thiomargarita sp.]
MIKVDPGDGGGGGGGFVHTIPVMNLDTLNRQLLSSKSIQEIRTHKKLNKSNADRKYDALKEKERERQGLSPQEALGVLERLKKSIGFLKLEAGITNTTAFHETDILKQAQIKLLESISYIKIPILFAEYIHLKDEDDNDNKKEQMMSARTARELMRLYGLESIVTQQDFQDGDFKSQVAISNYGELAPSISGFHPTTCVNYDNDIHFMKVSYRYFYPFGHIKQKHHQAAQQGNSFAQNNITHQVIDLSSAPISTLNRLIQNKFNTQCQHKINAYLKKMDVERSTHTTYQEARRNALNKARGIQSRYDDIKQRIRDLKTNQMFKQCRNIKCLLRQIKSKKKRLKKNKFIYRPVFKATSNNVRRIKTSIKRLLEDNILPKLNEDVNHHIISTLETMSQNKYQKEQNASNFKFSVHEFKIYWYSEENTVGIIAYFDLEFTPEITKIVRVGTHRLTFIPIKSNQLGKFFLAETETSMALLEQFIQENELERRDINKTCLKNKRKKYSAKKYLSMPASCVSVAGLEKFIEWVRAKTKKNIVIPSCKQWRHVASHGGDYSYCGRHNPCQGRKCTDNIGGSRQIGVRSARKTQIPRFYEMCGNVTEACVDEKDGVYLQIGPSVGSDFEEQEFSDNFDLYEFGAYATNGFRLAIDKK